MAKDLKLEHHRATPSDVAEILKKPISQEMLGGHVMLKDPGWSRAPWRSTCATRCGADLRRPVLAVVDRAIAARRAAAEDHSDVSPNAGSGAHRPRCQVEGCSVLPEGRTGYDVAVGSAHQCEGAVRDR